MIAVGAFTGVLLLALFAAGKAYFHVDEGHAAVLVSFGAADFIDHSAGRVRTFGPGLHFKWPWQRVTFVKMMEQNVELSGEGTGRIAMAHDGTVLRFDSVLRYQPMEESLATFLFGMRAPLEHITGAFTSLLRNEIANFRVSAGRSGAATSNNTPPEPDVLSHGGSYAVIRRERQRLNRQIEDFCRERIGSRYGVRFNAVDLVDILPPDELADALNAVINAQMEAEAAFFRAEADCQQRVLSAERGVEIAKSRAKAIEVEIGKLCTYLAELGRSGTLAEYVDRRRAEVMNESHTLLIREESAQ